MLLTGQVARYANFVRTAIEQTTELGDVTTAHLYIELSRCVDRYLWILESHWNPSCQE